MGDHDTVRERLRAAVRADDPWTALHTLQALLAPHTPPTPHATHATHATHAPHAPRNDPSERLAEAVEELYRSDPDRSASRRYLTWLLRSLGEPGDAVLLRLLADRTLGPDDRQDLLSTAVTRGLRLPAELLRTYLSDAPGSDGRGGARSGDAPTPELVDAMGLSGDPSFAPRLGALLGDPSAPRGRAALALGRLGARDWTEPIATRLHEVTGLDRTAFAVALELMGDPAAVPHLLRWLAESGEQRVYDVHHALVHLTGHDPLLPELARGEAYAAAVRAAWSDGRPEPRPAAVRDLVIESGTQARFSVDGGAGRIRVAFDPPSPGSSWPRWDRSLTIDRRPLYRVGSPCDTCELALSLLGWPDDTTPRLAARMREHLTDLHRLDAPLLAEWIPVLAELETGHYRALLLDLPLERVTDPAQSWWYRRTAARPDEDADDTAPAEAADDHPGHYWPGVTHFQLTAPVPGGRIPLTFGALLPSQPPESLDPATITRHTSAITTGARPAAVVLGWIDDRYVEAQHEERWLIGAILDGHHRLTAYAAAGIPARVLLLARVDGGCGADGGLEGLAELTTAYGCRD
ncbi:HEAT repeat domain-containing protein [Streptomyces sp. NPDC056361]|uniref:HEAT repeat domain-containing protein n=1 Tax=Streptomyces sp. NPDC056361 TaxID=3345795 RepID=UPI0035D94531